MTVSEPSVRRWKVLIVDDEPEKQAPIEAALQQLGDCEVLSPDAVAASDVLSADLVLVDLTLEYVDWIRTANSPIAQQPLDGLALTAVLRSHTTASEARRPFFALHTGHIESLVPDLPAEVEENAAARLNNLEWVFRKTDFGRDRSSPYGSRHPGLAERVSILARTSAELPTEWSLSADSAEEFTLRLLGVDQELSWSQSAYRDVRSCHPPLFELAIDTHGLSFVRWMLHRVLPYPCFILSDERLAHRLRLDLQIVDELLASNDEFASFLAPARYCGTLAGFCGTRWWRTGVDSLLSSLADGDPFDMQRIESGLERIAGRDLEFYSPSSVLNLDGGYQISSVGLRSSSVRISPDDWPPYAEQAFASTASAASDERLRRVVVFDDLPDVEER